uniref:Secreted protein n=1 Tax=Mesocestoides corti TaxID=53468 RepID=A0A5K3EQZ2_MESCO
MIHVHQLCRRILTRSALPLVPASPSLVWTRLIIHPCAHSSPASHAIVHLLFTSFKRTDFSHLRSSSSPRHLHNSKRPITLGCLDCGSRLMLGPSQTQYHRFTKPNMDQ